MEIIYIDSLFLLNFTIDYLLLLLSGRICALPLNRPRIALGALWGGAYAALVVLLPGFFALAAVKLLSGFAACTIAFAGSGRLLRACVCFLAVSAGFGGAVYAFCSISGLSATGSVYIPVSLRILFISFAVSYAAISLIFRRAVRRTARSVCSVSLSVRGKTACFSALYDSGNELCDPVSGACVMVAEAGALKGLFSDAVMKLLASDAIDALALLNGLDEARGLFRLMPCRSAGAGAALLLCFTPDSIRIDGKSVFMSVAVSRGALSSDGEYQAVYNDNFK